MNIRKKKTLHVHSNFLTCPSVSAYSTLPLLPIPPRLSSCLFYVFMSNLAWKAAISRLITRAKENRKGFALWSPFLRRKNV